MQNSKVHHNNNVPKVSIGMPVYNGEKFIHDALNSILAQTFTDFELIISDNGSTDSTEAICRVYAEKDDRIRYVRQVENKGGLFNFKFVLDEAVGDYFMWAAHDDVWDIEWIKVLYPISVANQCLAYGMVRTIDSKGELMQHPANNRQLNFTGAKFVRRLKYFSEPGFRGKVNPIYGIFPKKFMRSSVFDVLCESTPGSDSLMLYRLLMDIEIMGGSTVFLYKRIHADCLGVGGEISGIRKNITIRILKLPADIIHSQYRSLIDFGSLSGVTERLTQLLLTPILFFVILMYLVVNNPRFNRKRHARSIDSPTH
jgi:glycosyltransferase involved in cell wall biosynthesis